MDKTRNRGLSRDPRHEESLNAERLQAHIRALITIDETEALVLSCYANVEGAGASELPQRAQLVRKTLAPAARVAFDEALAMIQKTLSSPPLPATKGFAVFARGGEHPFLLPLQFQVEVHERLSVDSAPCIYPLVELKETYHRFIVMIANNESSRILEVCLGSLTKELWRERPQLRERVGRGWTRAHYQNHSRDDATRFIKEEVEVLSRLTSQAGHAHLILVGNPRVTAKIRAELPKHLADKVSDIISTSATATTADVVAATLSSFVAQQVRDSTGTVELLMQELRRYGLAAVGADATLTALERGQVDVLVLADDYQPSPGWVCGQCGRLAPGPERPAECQRCGEHAMTAADLHENLIRLAELRGARLVRVHDNPPLTELGGVGCLLRYRAADMPRSHAPFDVSRERPGN